MKLMKEKDDDGVALVGSSKINNEIINKAPSSVAVLLIIWRQPIKSMTNHLSLLLSCWRYLAIKYFDLTLPDKIGIDVKFLRWAIRTRMFPYCLHHKSSTFSIMFSFRKRPTFSISGDRGNAESGV